MKYRVFKTAPLTLIMLFFLTHAYSQISFTLTQAPCNNNGILTAHFSGFTPPLTVTWHPGVGSPVVHTVTGLSDALTGYSGASTYVVVTDANNLSSGATYQSALPFTYSVAMTPGVCPALSTLSVSVSGGAPPYTYQWVDKTTSATVGTTNPVSVPAGQYGITITDNNGCVFGSDATDDSIYVYQTSNINFAVGTTTANCTNGTATVSSITGGMAPYSILWVNAATTATITGLTKGVYSATVTDAQGCSTTKYANVQQSVNINVNITPTPATCVQNNGSAIAFGSGGVPPYTYLWTNTATTQTITGLSMGYYGVKITDANGCFGNGNAYVNASTPITATVSATASSCTSSTGAATVNISGGATPYAVLWNTSPAQTGTTATGLKPGNYSFKITDANGCIRIGTVYVSPVNIISLNTAVTAATCTLSNGSASVSASGGTSPYTYLWSNSATTTSINSQPGGSYSVKVTDNAGCSVTKAIYIPVSSPLQAGVNTTPASCIYNSDGAISAFAWGGTTPYTFHWTNSATTPTITGLKTGQYYLTVTDAVGCIINRSAFVSYNPANNSCYCTVTGTVYNDANSNCTKDPGEQGIPNIQVHCTGYGYAYTDANGVYSFKVPTGSYTLSETVLGYYPLASCQNNTVSVSVTAASNCTTTVNFANTVNTIHDMHISTWNFNAPVPGFPYNQAVLISNDGTVTESAGLAGYKTDGQLATPSFTPGGLFTGSGNYYKIPGTLSLAPAATKFALANYTVPTNIPLNTSLVFSDSVVAAAPISSWTSDYSPWNNVNNYTPLVVGSYDPNFKEVSPKGDGPTGIITYGDSVLEYMVHFQNVGTFKATNISIVDTLDADLDWTTMRPVYRSHPCTVTISDGGVAQFTFNHIDLPPAVSDEIESNGMITYTIKTKHGLLPGTQFKNSAAIYFDFNEPVITNTTVNTLGPLAVKQLRSATGSPVLVYPNPTNDMITVKMENNNYTTARIMNTMGQVVMTKDISGTQTTMSIGSLAPGIYYMLLSGSGGTTATTIEKQ